jgi:hypothetical protein
VQICDRHIDVELRAAQRHDELTSERVALDTQLTELHRLKATLEMEWATSIDFTKARAQARAVTTAVDHEGPQASQNVVAAATLLDNAHALHRWSGQSVPSAEGHPRRCHRTTGREFTPTMR